jgi:hypothetical protein
MSKNSSRGRAFVFMSALLFLSLFSCSSEKSRWKIQEAISQKPAYHSSKICYSTKNFRTGLELEVSQGLGGLRLHINVFSGKIPRFFNDPKRALLTIVDDHGKRNFLVHRFEGGQKLLFDQEQSKYLLSSLENSKEISILLEGYEERIDTIGFSELFSKI